MVSGMAPIGAGERSQALDMLRGVAVMGILAVNIWFMALPSFFYTNPNSVGPLEGVDKLVWSTLYLLVSFKFITLFSMMFGAGVGLMANRSSAGLHMRRMSWLLLFGIIHAYLIWPGDVLTLYAVCGFILTFMRNWSSHVLIVIAIVLIAIGGFLSWGFAAALEFAPPEDQAKMISKFWTPDQSLIDDEVLIRREGSWLQNVMLNIKLALNLQQMMLVLLIWRTLGVMLLGIVLWRSGVLTAGRSALFYAVLVVAGFGIGVTLSSQALAMREASDWDFITTMGTAEQFNYWGSFFTASGWIGVTMLIAKSPVLGLIRMSLAAAGRMAFTNYIMHSVIITLIMNSYGLGRFNEFSVTELFYMTAAVWALQLILSPIWLSVFRYGPLEWLWRVLTYGRTA